VLHCCSRGKRQRVLPKVGILKQVSKLRAFGMVEGEISNSKIIEELIEPLLGIEVSLEVLQKCCESTVIKCETN
jgi:hypothetical protein